MQQKNRRRTQEQIEKDYKSIRESAKSSASWKELESKTGLKKAAILVSLEKHPRVLKKIKEKFSGTLVKAAEVKASDEKQRKEKYIVIDTSVTGVIDIVESLLNQDKKIILTSVVIKELAQMQHFGDGNAMRARQLLGLPADYQDKFVHQLIDESFNTADECILQYCRKNASRVELYTADKEMYNFAMLYGIPVRLFRVLEEIKNPKRTTLRGLVRVGEKLVIDLDKENTSYKSVRVISNGLEYDSGQVKVKVGDEILLVSQKLEGYIAFAHYKIVALWERDNTFLMYSKRVYDLKQLETTAQYKSFVRTFKRKLQFN